jgi:hypothetical protein
VADLQGGVGDGVAVAELMLDVVAAATEGDQDVSGPSRLAWAQPSFTRGR